MASRLPISSKRLALSQVHPKRSMDPAAPVPEGLRSLTALLVLRDKVVKPLLAASNQPGLTTGPNHPTAADHRYEALRTEMRGLFTELGIAA